jgi:hypothetical protein
MAAYMLLYELGPATILGSHCLFSLPPSSCCIYRHCKIVFTVFRSIRYIAGRIVWSRMCGGDWEDIYARATSVRDTALICMYGYELSLATSHIRSCLGTRQMLFDLFERTIQSPSQTILSIHLVESDMQAYRHSRSLEMLDQIRNGDKTGCSYCAALIDEFQPDINDFTRDGGLGPSSEQTLSQPTSSSSESDISNHACFHVSLLCHVFLLKRS